MTTAGKITLLLLLTGLLFLPVYPELMAAWMTNSNNSHGMLVPLVSLGLIWQQKEILLRTPLASSHWGAGLLIASLILYLLSYAGGIAVSMRLALIGTLLGLVLLTLGPAIFQRLRFPLLFLLFMIPVPDALVGSVSFPLQLLATTVSADIIRGLSIPVVQEGNMLFFVQTQLEVAEACSGLRSLLALTMLSVLFAHILNGSRRNKWLLVMSAIPVALLANILRVSGTGVLAHFFGEDVASGFLHTFSGIAVFLFGMVLLAIESFLLRDRPKAAVSSDGREV